MVKKLELLQLVWCYNKETPTAFQMPRKSDAHQLPRAKRKIQVAKLIGDLKMGNKSKHVQRRRGLLQFRLPCSTSEQRVGLLVAGCRHRSWQCSGGRQRRGEQRRSGRRRWLAERGSRWAAPEAGGGGAARRLRGGWRRGGLSPVDARRYAPVRGRELEAGGCVWQMDRVERFFFPFRLEGSRARRRNYFAGLPPFRARVSLSGGPEHGRGARKASEERARALFLRAEDPKNSP